MESGISGEVSTLSSQLHVFHMGFLFAPFFEFNNTKVYQTGDVGEDLRVWGEVKDVIINWGRGGLMGWDLGG